MFKKILLILTPIAYLLTPSWAGTKSNTAIKAFNDGVSLVNNGDYQNAVEHFDDAIAADPDFAEAYYVRGVCRYSLKGMDGALLDLSDAVRLKPDLLEARALRGLVQYETEHFDEALDDVNYVLARKPDDAQSLLVRGILELKRDDATGARRDFKAFVKLKPDDPMVPKIQEVLASLGEATAGASKKVAHRPPPHPSTENQDQAQAPSSESNRGSAEAPTLNTRALAEKFGEQLLQGDQGPIVGNINQRAQVRSDNP